MQLLVSEPHPPSVHIPGARILDLTHRGCRVHSSAQQGANARLLECVIAGDSAQRRAGRQCKQTQRIALARI